MTTYQASLPYAPIVAPRGQRAWAGAALLFGGVSLIVLAGCFLIGVLIIVSPQVLLPGAAKADLTPGEIGLMMVLYLLTFLAVAGGATLLVVGARGLVRLLNDRPTV